MLTAAGYPPQHIGELLDHLAGMRPGARRRMERLLADFLLA